MGNTEHGWWKDKVATSWKARSASLSDCSISLIGVRHVQLTQSATIFMQGGVGTLIVGIDALSLPHRLDTI